MNENTETNTGTEAPAPKKEHKTRKWLKPTLWSVGGLIVVGALTAVAVKVFGAEAVAEVAATAAEATADTVA
jgi:predicted secreted protein